MTLRDHLGVHHNNHDAVALDGWRKKRSRRTTNRIRLTMAAVCVAYGAVFVKLSMLGMTPLDEMVTYSTATGLMARPDILDAKGELLATDIRTSSLFAEPRRIVDADEAIELLSTVLPDLDGEDYKRKLTSNSGFVWLKRQITPREERAIRALGIPGVAFRAEYRRIYPKGSLASHIHGIANIDNKGLTGMERYIDSLGFDALQSSGMTVDTVLTPVTLSIDANIQHVVRDELVHALDKYQAIAVGGIVLNAKTGEVVAMASLPDFDPNNPVDIGKKDRLNRMAGGVYEMGSTIKAFTTAMALDSNKVKMTDRFDARKPIRIGGHTINDFHAKKAVLSVEEVFIFSSNIGTAKMADVVGIEGHRDFLKRMGMLTKVQTELPEVATPTEPKEWKKINSVTISFGHGMATTPLQTAVGAAAILNGGKLIPPTFLPRTEEEANAIATQVLDPQTSDDMRYLFRLNSEKGSGRRAEAEGYFVGGKTGTAEKVVNGRYSSTKKFNAFLAAFPIDDPQYIVLTIIDEPQPAKGQATATAGLNAAPVAGAIIRRSAPLLGLQPDFSHDIQSLEAKAYGRTR